MVFVVLYNLSRGEKIMSAKAKKHLLSIFMALLCAGGIILSGVPQYVSPADAYGSGIILSVRAKETTTDYVATTSLNIRSKASTKGKKVGSFSKGDTVQVYSITDGWAKIEYNGSTAYTSAQYLAEPGTKSSGRSSSSSNKNSSHSSKGRTNSYSANVSGAVSASRDSGDITVWLSATGSKYHSRNNCGRMNPNKAIEVTKSYAESAGYDPCGKCW